MFGPPSSFMNPSNSPLRDDQIEFENEEITSPGEGKIKRAVTT
jgi:hypothetical protein